MLATKCTDQTRGNEIWLIGLGEDGRNEAAPHRQSEMESRALDCCGNLLDGPGLCEDVHGQFLGRNEYAL